MENYKLIGLLIFCFFAFIGGVILFIWRFKYESPVVPEIPPLPDDPILPYLYNMKKGKRFYIPQEKNQKIKCISWNRDNRYYYKHLHERNIFGFKELRFWDAHKSHQLIRENMQYGWVAE